MTDSYEQEKIRWQNKGRCYLHPIHAHIRYRMCRCSVPEATSFFLKSSKQKVTMKINSWYKSSVWLNHLQQPASYTYCILQLFILQLLLLRLNLSHRPDGLLHRDIRGVAIGNHLEKGRHLKGICGRGLNEPSVTQTLAKASQENLFFLHWKKSLQCRSLLFFQWTLSSSGISDVSLQHRHYNHLRFHHCCLECTEATTSPSSKPRP